MKTRTIQINVTSTQEDLDALKLLPTDGWFDLWQVPWKIKGPGSRMDRLWMLGYLDKKHVMDRHYPSHDGRLRIHWKPKYKVTQDGSDATDDHGTTVGQRVIHEQ